MKTLEAGKCYPEFIGRPEGAQFDLTDSGAILTTTFYCPTENEISQFATGKHFEIRFVQIHDVIMLTAKIGDLYWMDMPYTPHLSQHLSELNVPKDGEGLLLQIRLFDTATGELKKIRVISLSSWFTKNLFKAVMDIKEKPFDINLYDKNITTIYTSYTTCQLAKISRAYSKAN